jgi:hypothetical protein
MGRFLSPDWAAQEEPVPYAQRDNPQSLNLYAYVQNNPLTRIDADGHNWMDLGVSGNFRDYDAQVAAKAQQAAAQAAQRAAAQTSAAQQTYGRQPDGSYKADPADVQKAIDDKKPIHEPGNPDKSSQCVFACKVLSRMKNISTPQWSKGRPALELNDTTDIGLAIATLGSGSYPTDGDRNSGIYMGHDGNGGIRIVDQWPDNGPDYDHPREHTLTNRGQPSMNSSAYFVIIVKNP